MYNKYSNPQWKNHAFVEKENKFCLLWVSQFILAKFNSLQ